VKGRNEYIAIGRVGLEHKIILDEKRF